MKSKKLPPVQPWYMLINGEEENLDYWVKDRRELHFWTVDIYKEITFLYDFPFEIKQFTLPRKECEEALRSAR